MTGGLDVAHHTRILNGIKQHYVIAGSGPPVFLLHGYPEFRYAWRYQIPALARKVNRCPLDFLEGWNG